MRRLALGAAILLVLSVSVSAARHTGVTAPTTAFAAACWDSGCQGMSPTGTGCTNGSDLVDAAGDTAQANDIYYVQLGYSPSCGSDWGTTYSPQPQTCYGTPGWCSGIHLQQSCCGGYVNGADEGPNYYPYTYRTTMLSGISSYDRVCSWGWSVCTAWH